MKDFGPVNFGFARFHVLSETRVGPSLLLGCFSVFGVANTEASFCFPYVMGFVVGAGVFIDAAFVKGVRFTFIF